MNKINHQYFREALKQKRKKMSKVQRKRKLRIPKRLYPWATEKRYKKQISAWLRPLVRAVNTYIKAHSEALIRGDNKEYSIINTKHNSIPEETETRIWGNIRKVDTVGSVWYEANYVRWDALPGKGFQTFLDTLKAWMGMYFPGYDDLDTPSSVLIGIGGVADSLEMFAAKEWEKASISIIGSSFSTSQVWWPDMKEAWVESNYDFIKSIAEKYISSVNMEVERAILNGWSSGSLAEDIMDMGLGIEGWQATRLARDQIGKLNGAISYKQNEEAGIEMYEWSTAGDERVRGTPGNKKTENAIPSHFLMEGVLCRWDDPTVYSDDDGETWIPREPDMPMEHPGFPIQCRCTAISRMDKITKQVDQEISAEEGETE